MINRNEILQWIKIHQNFLIQIRDEAHRFAVGYQRKTRRIK